MALFETQTTSSLADLISKLNTFLTTGGGGNPGWTADRHVPASGEWAISKDDGSGQSVEVAFQWDTSTPSALGVYQYISGSGAGNYNTGAAPYAQNDDSGNGAASTSNATLLTSRHVPIGNTPLQYWAFTGDTYAHIVVETAADTFVHFGFGVLDKFNDFTGGEYCYGYKFQGGTNNSVAVQARSSLLLDGLANGTTPDAMQSFAATMHLEGMSDSPASGLWAVCLGNQSSSGLGQDRQGSPIDRIHVLGGCRAGSHATDFGQFIGTLNMGLIPSYPIVSYHFDRDVSGSSGTPGAVACLGAMKDVRGILMTNFAAKDQVTIDGDTWHIFPARARGDAGSLTNTTGYQGLMYKEN